MIPRELSGPHDGEKRRSDQESEGSPTSKIDFATHGPTYKYQGESANREINTITLDGLSNVNSKFKRLSSIFESIDSIKILKLEIDSKSIKNLEEMLNKKLEISTNELKRRKIRCALFDLGDTLWTHRDKAPSDNTATQSLADSRILFNDTHSTLKELQQHGFILGIVTNRREGGESFRKDLEDLGLLQYFNPNCIVSSADIGVKKPNPEIFSHALTALNVKPEEAVMVGNSLYADIFGAKAVGIGAIWKPTASYYAELQKELPQADLGDGNHLNLLNIAHKHEDEYYGEKAKRTTTLPNAIIKNTGDLLKILLKTTN